MAQPREPASIRFKNPGAMWGGNAVTKKWGEVGNVALNDGLGQGNHIAVFPTFVHGICAQIDLWRSTRYRNKPFKVAIVPWSGGNNVPSYIQLVQKHVSNFTGDTIINDAFLNSTRGIQFLKAQAWHEAGKPYPAPDSDFLLAQSIIFSGAKLPKTSAINVQKPTAAKDDALEEIQNELKEFGYHEIGEADGRIGGKTLGAIKAFYTDRGNSAHSEYPSEVLRAELDAAKAEHWHRPIAPSRAFKTEKELAPQIKSVAPTQNAGLLAKVGGWFTGLTATGKAAMFMMPDINDQASPYLSMVQQFWSDIPGWVFPGVIAAVCVAIVIQSNKANKATVADYQQGKIN